MCLAAAGRATAPRFQSDAESLEHELTRQYATIERVIAAPPDPVMSGSYEQWKTDLRRWQDGLAHQFGRAADLVEEIIKTNPPQIEQWRERLEALRLYAQPISSPDKRDIYGAGEVEKRVHLLDAPRPVRVGAATGDVRLRMVLAADGTVKYGP